MDVLDRTERQLAIDHKRLLEKHATQLAKLKSIELSLSRDREVETDDWILTKICWTTICSVTPPKSVPNLKSRHVPRSLGICERTKS